MAQLIEGDSRGLHRGLIGNPPGLPPKFPSLSNKGVSLSELDNGFYNNQGRNEDANHWQHKRTPSCCIVIQNQQPFLLDKSLEEKDFPIAKGLHRRSASGSFTYLEKSENMSLFSNIAEEDESECPTAVSAEKAATQGNEDGDQLTDLLQEIQQLHNQQNLPISAAVHHKSDSLIVNTKSIARASSLEAVGPAHMSLEPIGRCQEDGEYFFLNSSHGDPFDLPESELDPKKAKRVLANRQSAQRSRVRKLQYIAELERIVNTLQTEVSSLLLQLIYLKHQRALLNMDNNALKQQAVFFVQEKRNKDSQNEVLMHDIRRLKKLSEFQLLHKSSQLQKQLQPQHQHIKRHSSLPSDFVANMHQPEDLRTVLEQERSGALPMDGLMAGFGAMSLDTKLDQESMSRHSDLSGVGTTLAMHVAAAGSFDSKVVTSDT